MSASPLDALLSLPPQERRLGPYLLEKQLGRGGFAPVWKAREIYGDTEVRTVALKVFRLEPSARPITGPLSARPLSSAGPPSEHHDRVIREAQALCRVEHPHIVRFYTLYIDQSARVLGLVMEYLPGRSLEQRLREQGTLSPGEAIELGVQLASALRAVHEAGLVHRDLKPANIVEARGGHTIIDFGIAESEAPPARTEPRRVVLDDLPFEVAGTRMSMLVGAATIDGATSDAGGPVLLASGTVGYMDPQSVATGAVATPASDLYGLGAVLFEALTGRLPSTCEGAGFSGEILDGRAPAPSLASLVPAAPAALGRLVDALLSPQREQRPPSAAAVEDALRALQPSPVVSARSLLVGEPAPASSETGGVGGTSGAAPAAARPRGWWLVAGAAIGLAVVLGALGVRGPAQCTPGNAVACGARCERGEGASCHTLGLMYEQASGVPKDEARAADLFRKGCDGGHGAACYALGAMREQGRGGARDPQAARRLYERACELGDAQGCNALAIQLAAGVGGDADRTRVVQLYQRACDLGYPNGCANLGALHERGDGVPRDEPRARALYERACADGAASSCGLLALSLLAGRGGPADPQRASDLFERSCTSGHAFSCVGLGVMLEQSATGPSEREKAAQLYRRACDEGESQGCFYLGHLHQRGVGVALDEVQAFVLFQRSCDRGLPAGCRLAGEASATGRGVQRDDTRAVGFFRRACAPESQAEPPDAEGCAWLAVHLREGRGVEKSADEAEALRRKACGLGARTGCATLPAPSIATPPSATTAAAPPPISPPRSISCAPGDPLCGH